MPKGTLTPELLHESAARIQAILKMAVNGIITIDEHGCIESFNQAAEHIFGYEEFEILGKNVNLLMPAPYHEEHDGYIATYLETGVPKIIGIGREVTGQRKDGTIFPMDLAVSEIEVNGRRTFTGIIRDISRRRGLENEILRVTEQERRRIGQDLHDGLGQMLTGIGLICRNVAKNMAREGINYADSVTEIADLIQEADQQARTLARGLMPVELERNGLNEALHRLCINAERLFQVRCVFEDLGKETIIDDSVALQMYRIGQEAINNACKHAQAIQVTVTWVEGQDFIRLVVKDDGVGFPNTEAAPPGMGVDIMKYRANLIGAKLDIRPRPSKGTTLTCTLHKSTFALS